MAIDVPRLYALADTDRDGKISGTEAVRFLQKSGLSNEVLGQIWDLASAGQPVLLLPQFAAAMRLVSLAQLAGGRLPPPGDQACRLAAIGQGPPLPPPRLAGVDTGGGPPAAAAAAAGPTGGAAPPYAPQLTGASSAYGGSGAYGGAGLPPPPPPVYAPQATGAAAAYGYIPQATGGSSFAAGPTGGVPPLAAPLPLPPGALPPCSPADVARYSAAFRQADADADGLVRGAEALGPLARTGVDRAVLRRVWDSVAGPSAGALTQQQFCAALYLAEAARAVGPAAAAALFGAGPRLLPPGPFPPVVPGAPSLDNNAGVAAAAPAAFAAGGGGGATGASVASASQQRQQQQPPPPPASPKIWTLASQFGGVPASKVVADAYDNPAPKLPQAPGKAVWDPRLQQVVRANDGSVVTPGGSGEGEASAAAAAAAAAARQPRPAVPDLDAALKAALAAPDIERLGAARGDAQRRDDALRQAESDAAAQRRRGEAFAEVLGEVALFKSRTDVALLQAREEAERLCREADEFERRYAAQELEVEERRRKGDEAHARVRAALAAREEAATRLRLLREELEMVARLNPQEVAALEKEVSELASRAAAAEAEKAAAALALESGRAQRALLASRVDDLKMAAAAAEAELGRTRAEVAEVAKRAEAALAAALAGAVAGTAPGTEAGAGAGAAAAAAAEEGSGGGAEIASLLSRAAAAYRSLHSAAAAHGVEVPYEASVSGVGGLVWLEQLMAGTADWAEWGAEDGGVAAAGAGAGAGAGAAGADGSNKQVGGGVSASLLPAAVGYALVNALPDLEGVPPALLRPTAEIFVVRQPQQPKGAAAEEDEAGADDDGGAEAAAAATAGAAAAAGDAEAGALSPAASGGPAMRPRAASGSGGGGGAATAGAAAEAEEEAVPDAAPAAAASTAAGAAVTAIAAAAAADGDGSKPKADAAPEPTQAAAAAEPSGSDLTATPPAPAAAAAADDHGDEDAATPLAAAGSADGGLGGAPPPASALTRVRTDDDSDVMSDPGHGLSSAKEHNNDSRPSRLTQQSSGFLENNAFAAAAAPTDAGAAAAPDDL